MAILDFRAFPSSIESGWYQCSGGINPNSIGEGVKTVIRLGQPSEPLNDRKSRNALFELVCEWFFIQEDIRDIGTFG
jgi:hypothetical protein